MPAAPPPPPTTERAATPRPSAPRTTRRPQRARWPRATRMRLRQAPRPTRRPRRACPEPSRRRPAGWPACAHPARGRERGRSLSARLGLRGLACARLPGPVMLECPPSCVAARARVRLAAVVAITQLQPSEVAYVDRCLPLSRLEQQIEGRSTYLVA